MATVDYRDSEYRLPGSSRANGILTGGSRGNGSISPKRYYGRGSSDPRRKKTSRTTWILLGLTVIGVFVVFNNRNSIWTSIDKTSNARTARVTAAMVASYGKPQHVTGSRRRKDQKIALITYMTNEATFAWLVLKNRNRKGVDVCIEAKADAASLPADYAKRHGYDFVMDFEADAEHGIIWYKYDIVEKFAREKKYDWMWFLDFDALITNTDTLIESIIDRAMIMAPEPSDVKIILTEDCNGYNAGSFIMKGDDTTAEILHRIHRVADEKRRENPHIDSMTEQEATKAFIASGDPLARHILFVPQVWINAVPEEAPCTDDNNMLWKEGQFALHFAGCWAYLQHIDNAVQFLMDKYKDKIRWGPEVKFAWQSYSIWGEEHGHEAGGEKATEWMFAPPDQPEETSSPGQAMQQQDDAPSPQHMQEPPHEEHRE